MADQLDTLKSALAERYAVERELGAGGMATVYLARDLKHDRLVAIKVVRPEIAAALGTERFLREIQVTARLQHPHVLPLYDSGEADGVLYYVMPYIEGESLRDLLEREQQLGLGEAIKITAEVAEALAHAHSYGIVHRDIKPENILLSGGHPIVADFGIARAVSEAGGEKLTQTGMAVGTPAYMSPEQASGDPHTDARTDIYSLGCVLYETLVGQPPFTGPTPQAVMARHSMDHVPLPHVVRQSIPEALEAVVLCMLEKAPADRFHTAREVAEALNAVTSGEVPHLTNSALARARRRDEKQRRTLPLAAVVGVVVVVAVAIIGWQLWPRGPVAFSDGDLDPTNIAVLYFEDRSPGGELAHVADGLTEGLIRELSRVGELEVTSRNGSAQFRGSTAPPDSIARALNTGTLVDGSVEPAGESIRIMLRLIEGSSGADFERSALDVPRSQLFAAQDSVAYEVSIMLRERVGDEIRLRESREATESADAWVLLQRGERARKDAEGCLESGDAAACDESFQRADSMLGVAESADPDWVEPIALRAEIALRRSRLASDLEVMLAAIDDGMGHAERVLQVDARHARALELRGTLQYWHWLLDVTPDPAEADRLFDGARRDLEAAVDADPSLASAYSTLSHLYYNTDILSALLAAQRAYETDAYLAAAPDVLWRLFWGSYDLERLTQARSWCDEGRRRFPDNFRFAECKLRELEIPGVTPDVAEAWRLLDELTTLAPGSLSEYYHSRGSIIVAAVLSRAGHTDSARTVLAEARAGPEVDIYGDLPFFEAHVRTMLGDYDEAVSLLGRYVVGAAGEDEEGDAEWATYWWWRDLQGHPGFQRLVEATQ